MKDIRKNPGGYSGGIIVTIEMEDDDNIISTLRNS